MEYKDYYKILGIEKNATPDQIKQTYRKLARKYHPDVSKEPNAEEKFKAVQEAYEVLKDPEKRKTYDELGTQWQGGQRSPPNWDGNFNGFGGAEGMGGGFSDFFEAIFGGTRQRGHQRGPRQSPFARKGADQHAQITISLEEAFHGGSKTIQFQVPEMDAQGQITPKLRTLKITIPPGTTQGQKLRLAKQGAPGIGQGEPGDLILEIHIQPHRYFKVEGYDVLLNLPVTPWEAALGAKVTVPTLGGSVDLKINPGVISGQKMRLKGRGLPNKPSAGDQYVILQIATPPATTVTERELYEKMAKEMPFNPRQFLS